MGRPPVLIDMARVCTPAGHDEVRLSRSSGVAGVDARAASCPLPINPAQPPPASLHIPLENAKAFTWAKHFP